MIARIISVCALALFLTVPSEAGIVHDVFRDARPERPTAVTSGRLIVTNINEVASIVHARAPLIILNVPMPDGGALPLTLQRISVVDMMSRVTFMTENGPQHQPMLPSVVTYRAALADNGMAVFTFDAAGTVSGVIDRSGERVVVSRRRGDDDPTSHVVIRDHARPYVCGTETSSLSTDLQRIMEQAEHAVKEQGARTQALDTIEMKVAIEVDNRLYRAFGNKQLVLNYITELFAVVSTIYERELAVRLTISNLRLWEQNNDPYSANKGIFDGLLEEFINEYRNDMTGVDRDIAVFLTRRNSGGGIAATIGGICQEDGSYACADVNVSLETNGDGWVWDYALIAHEMGHVCGGLHTQSCFWPTGPLDSCVVSQNGDCVTQGMTRPARGTIMSYCHINPASRMTTEFHPMSRNVISAYLRSAPCMDGEAPARTARLHGIVRDGNTGEPLAGVKLILGRYIDEVFRQVPPVDGDTVTTSGPDGSYSFTGLGYGIYSVSYDDGWVPAVVDGLPFPNCVSIADTVSRLDLRATRGQRVEFLMTTKVKNISVRLTLYSDKLPSAMMMVNSPLYILPVDDTTFKYVTFLPDGHYVAVPHAATVMFTPNKITFSADHTMPAAVIRMHGESAGLSNTTAIAMGVVEMVIDNGVFRPRFLSGIPYVARNVELGTEAGRGTVPDDGVVVIDSVLTPYQYAFTFPVDTLYQVPFSGTGTVNPRYQRHAGLFAVQQRRKPLIARAYRMQVQQRSYETLQNATVIASTAIGSARAPVQVTMPFPLRIIDRELTSVQISHNGFLCFGPGTADQGMTHPFESSVPSPFSIAVLTGDMYPGDRYPPNPSMPWSIAYDVTGIQPDRTLRVEWSNVSAFVLDDNYDPVWVGPFSFQVHIHENGSIDMQYKEPDQVQWPFPTRIGLRGNDMYDNMLVTTPAPFYPLNNAQARFTLSADNEFPIVTPTQFTPGLTYHWEIDPALSVDEDDVQTMSIRPSVSSTSIELHGVRGDVSVRMVDLMGTVVRAVDLTGGERTIDISGLASGRYTAVFTLEGAVHALPFLVTR